MCEVMAYAEQVEGGCDLTTDDRQPGKNSTKADGRRSRAISADYAHAE